MTLQYYIILKFILFHLLILNSLNIFSQERKPIFLGIQPGITKEEFYEKDEFDVNVVPLVFQIPISIKFDFRFVTIANYHFGTKEAFSDIGFQSVFPFYFRKKMLPIHFHMDFILVLYLVQVGIL